MENSELEKLKAENEELKKDIARLNKLVASRSDENKMLFLSREKYGELIKSLITAGDKLYKEAYDAYGWINFGAIKPGEGLCICHVVKDIEIDIDTIQPPEKHEELCTQWWAAIKGWRDVKTVKAVAD